MSDTHIRRLVLVGPAPCRGCLRPVWWCITWAWAAWTDRHGQRHECAVEKAA